MVLGFLTQNLRMEKKEFLAILLLFLPSFAWFFLFQQCFFSFNKDFWIGWVNLGNARLGNALFLLLIVASAIIGSMLSEKWRRRRILGLWISLGVVTTLLPLVYQELLFLVFVSVLAGISFGLGFPSTLAFFSDSTAIEERARVSGALIFLAFVFIILLIGITQQLNFSEKIFTFTILRALSFFPLLTSPFERVVCKENKWMTVFETRGFGLFFLSWLMFSVAAGIFGFIEIPETVRQEETSVAIFLYTGVVISALISGFASDRFGRKKVIIFGLITLGISYQIFAIATSPESYLLTRLIYGTAWGIIFVSYMLTVIGDFARTCSKEKFYTIGLILPLIVFVGLIFFSDPSISIKPSLISPILGTMLFISVLPLLYAPETLPRKIIQQRKIKEHLKKVKELVEEEETQNQS